MRRESGFTLLEVLVAMSIFAVIGLGAHKMLRTIIQTHDRTQAQIEQFSAMTSALATMQRDFSQIVLRDVRDEYGERLPALMVGVGPFLVEMTRTGWNNPLSLARSNLQRVAYEVTDKGDVIRHFWLVLDRAEDSAPIDQTLLTGVSDLRVSLVDETGNVTNAWPDSSATSLLPVSVELVFETKTLGTIRKVFNIVDVALIRAPAGDGTNGSDGGSGSSNSDGQNADQNGDTPDNTPGSGLNRGLQIH